MRVNVGGTGVFDISLITPAALTINSLSGASGSSVVLGAKALTVSGGTTTFGGVISGATGSLTKAGTGTLTLTGTNTYLGTTTVSGGVLQIGNGGTTGSVPGNITDTANVTFNRSDNVTFGNVISGSGGTVTQAGPGTLILSNDNTYTGVTTISAGTLQIGNGGTRPVAFPAAAILSITPALVFNRSDSPTYSGVISGNWFCDPRWREFVCGHSDWSKHLYWRHERSIPARWLFPRRVPLSKRNVGAVNVSATFGKFDISGIVCVGSLTIGSLTGVSGSSVVLGSKALTVGGDGTSTTFGGVISGATGTLTKVGGGTFVLSGDQYRIGRKVRPTISAGVLQGRSRRHVRQRDRKYFGQCQPRLQPVR